MKKLFHELFSEIHGGTPFAIRYPDGTTSAYGAAGIPKFTLVFRTDAAMRAILVNVDLGFGEAYMYGDIDIEGSLVDLLTVVWTEDVAGSLRKAALRPSRILRFLPGQLRVAWQYLWQPHTYEKDKRYISEPYDLGNDFYAKWLDKDLLYSCGYFKSADDSIDVAQEQKREHVCRKLRLSRGETLLDIGCGWGGLLIYAAKHHGISGVGVTLSREQAAFGNQRIREAGLQDRIRVEHCHWMDLEKGDRVFDKVSSVGCLEHVGKRYHDRFFAVVKKSLSPRGTFVLHTIGRYQPGGTHAFGNKYIFPGVYTASLVEIAGCLARLGMRIQDVENLRLHYSYTTKHWLDAFEAHAEEFRTTYGEPFVRMFRLYLANGVAMMAHGDNELYQVVATPGIDNERPLTRDFLHRS